MKAIHNTNGAYGSAGTVVLYPKDTEKWKQFTTIKLIVKEIEKLFCIPKILKNESNSQHAGLDIINVLCCFVSQRYWKMKAIHNTSIWLNSFSNVVLYPKDTEKWKQFTTEISYSDYAVGLFCIPKILKNESNSQLGHLPLSLIVSCFVSQRYWKMKAIHNMIGTVSWKEKVVLYPKDTEKWKQFTT